MARISWGSPGTRKFEAGIDRGVFYNDAGQGFPWNGLVSIKEDPAGQALPVQYVDGSPIRSQKTKEGFAAVLQAYTCPREFEEYEGWPGNPTGQRRKVFGLSYRTLIGDDLSGLNSAYKIHIVYNCSAMPSAVDFSTIKTGGLDATPFSWGISTVPVDIPGAKPAAHLIVDTSIAYPGAIAELEDILYGNGSNEPRLPDVDELLDLFERHAILVIIDHGDGTWSAIGPDSAIQMLDANTFQITWPSAIYLDSVTYEISSL